MDSRRRSEYVNKVKCSTLKSAQTSAAGTKEPGKLMLGLSNTEESPCEYEPKSILTQQKKTWPKEPAKLENTIKPLKIEHEIWKEMPVNPPLLTESTNLAYVPEKAVPIAMKTSDNPLSFFNEPEPIESNSKAFMGSFGSWINDLFNAPNTKRPHTAPNIESKKSQPEVVTEENSNYFKSINVLKEQFRKKLKSETSVHVFNGDKVFHLNFNKSGNKKTKKRSKSLTSTRSIENDLFPYEEEFAESGKSGGEVRRQNSNDLLDSFVGHKNREMPVELFKAKNTFHLNNSNLIREKIKPKRKERANYGRLEEYVVPVPADLTKRLLLNLDDQEKTSRLYKNSHVGKPENQHYVQRKSKSYQNSTRCYTTNATLGESLEHVKSKTLVGVKKSNPMISPNKRKALGEFSRDNSTFVKIRSAKSVASPHINTGKLDSKGSSDDLVKYLMKKVKVQHRPQQTKRKSFSVSQAPALTSGKTKFMQSATSSLVMNALSKKDNDVLLPVRNTSRITEDKNDFLSGKAVYSSKTWNARYDDIQARLDVKRVKTQNKLNKSTYLSDDLDPNYLFFDRHYKYAKRFYEASFKPDVNDEKYGRRTDGKSAISKLDKSNIYKVAKVKPKDSKKKSMPSLLENFDCFDGKENSSGKFQHQHELFKNNLKTVLQNTEPESETLNSNVKDSDVKFESSSEPVADTSSLPTELAIVDNFQLIPCESTDLVQCDPNDNINSSFQNDGKETTDKVLECFSIDDNALHLSLDKSKSSDKMLSPLQNKLSKSKSSDILLASPPEPEKVSTAPGAFETVLSGTQDVRQSKSLDTTLLNRRLPANNISKQKAKSLSINHKAFSSTMTEKDNFKKTRDFEKNQSKDKKKDSLKKAIEESTDCGFEKTKKPGPNCEEEVSS